MLVFDSVTGTHYIVRTCHECNRSALHQPVEQLFTLRVGAVAVDITEHFCFATLAARKRKPGVPANMTLMLAQLWAVGVDQG